MYVESKNLVLDFYFLVGLLRRAFLSQLGLDQRIPLSENRDRKSLGSYGNRNAMWIVMILENKASSYWILLSMNARSRQYHNRIGNTVIGNRQYRDRSWLC